MKMKFIGLTGGVGAGKSEILAYLEEKEGVRVLRADEIAHTLMEPGTECYKKIRKLFLNKHVFLPDGAINSERMAKVLFSDAGLRAELNAVVHPAVKNYVLEAYENGQKTGGISLLVLEAALLIEEHYDEICDELWYVAADEEIRRLRLKATRGYTEEKIQKIFDSQLKDEIYRKYCKVCIDNNGDLSETLLQIDEALEGIGIGAVREKTEMSEERAEEQQLVFGLDIGTRNIVGTVGYRIGEELESQFIVVAQCTMEHETRSMLDGQIHDIGRVGRTVRKVKEKLEAQVDQPLTEVCIAAAGRVLKTVTTRIEYEYPEETVVTGEDIHTLDLLGVEKAQGILKEKNDTKYKFYCVGYSVVKYYLNDEIFSNLEGHKAEVISEDIIVTFLPEDVVDGLYSAVAQAGLSVANMTLEPIAAINVAIPETFRMLNIALVDIGAGTSDICVTRDGSIIAYGMIPLAGDELTEILVQHYLVDFKTAEKIKLASGTEEEITYRDIMLIEHTIPVQEVWDLLAPIVDRMTTEVAAKIRELNGDKPVSATFVVGGGGKIHGYTELLAEKLDLPKERVALRGEEVLQEVIFEQKEIEKDPLLVTPIGICLNYYDQKNSFIMVRLNGERIKLYDNNKLTIVDAALQAGFPNEDLFPKRGKEIHFTVDGVKRIARGEPGESAIVKINDKPAGINTPLEPNCEITIEKSTSGADASLRIDQLEEYQGSTVTFIVNGKTILCPKFVEVNGSLEPGSYEIKEGDKIETRAFYTVGQVAAFMDVEIDPDKDILVNNRSVDTDALVYENFNIEWTALSFGAAEPEKRQSPPVLPGGAAPKKVDDESGKTEPLLKAAEKSLPQETAETAVLTDEKAEKTAEEEKPAKAAATDLEKQPSADEKKAVQVFINGESVIMTGKKEYTFVDIFDYYAFDIYESRGRAIITKVNDEEAKFNGVLSDGDKIELAWKEEEK